MDAVKPFPEKVEGTSYKVTEMALRVQNTLFLINSSSLSEVKKRRLLQMLPLFLEEIVDMVRLLQEQVSPETIDEPSCSISETVDFLAAQLTETLANSKEPKSGLITVESEDGKPLAACFFARPAGNVLEQLADTFKISKTVIIAGDDL